MRAPLEDRVYGCDICQDVCPWNRGVEKRRSDAPGRGEAAVSLVEWLAADGADLRRRYERLYVPRNDSRYLKRNALVALGNTGGPEHLEALEGFDEDELLGPHAAWARSRIEERSA
jgi:epoxyqueuosine reductase